MTPPMIRSILVTLVLALGLTFAGGNRVYAYGIVVPDPGLPPSDPAAAYVGQNSVVYSQYGVTLNVPFFIGNFTNIQVATQGANEIANFDASFSGVATAGGVNFPFLLSGPVSMETFGNAGLTTGTFNEQLLSVDFTGTVAGNSVAFILDPSQASTGAVTVSQIGVNPPSYNITSFFDIFTELSINQGPFDSASASAHITLESVPEPSTWILSITAGLILSVTHAARSRRRARLQPAA